MKVKLLISALLFPFIISAQKGEDLTTQLKEAMETYRTEIVADLEDHLPALDSLYKKLLRLGLDQEKAQDLFFNASYVLKLDLYSCKQVRKKIKEDFGVPGLADSISNAELDLLAINDDLFDLIHLTTSKFDYPFRPEFPDLLLEELQFYDIQNGESIGEVGAGSGAFSILLGIMYEKLHLYINEVTKNKVKYLENKIENCKSNHPDNQLIPVLGKVKSTSLEGQQLDKIILRRTYHHLKHKKEMLVSIKRSLAPGGELLIMDPVQNLKDDTPGCSSVMKKEDLLGQMEFFGFTLIEQKEVKNNYILLRYKVRI